MGHPGRGLALPPATPDRSIPLVYVRRHIEESEANVLRILGGDARLRGLRFRAIGPDAEALAEWLAIAYELYAGAAVVRLALVERVRRNVRPHELVRPVWDVASHLLPCRMHELAEALDKRQAWGTLTRDRRDGSPGCTLRVGVILRHLGVEVQDGIWYVPEGGTP